MRWIILGLVFLCPLAIYLLVLGLINRRRNPLVVSGPWDFVGVLFGASGVLLSAGPFMLDQMNDRWLTEMVIHGNKRASDTLIGLWIMYYGVVASGAVLMLVLRRRVTSIYNVEPEMVEEALTFVLTDLGLEGTRAAIHVDSFASMCHVTLVWPSDLVRRRPVIEELLSKFLDQYQTVDNSAGIWLLTISSSMFLLIVFTATIILIEAMKGRL